MSRYSLSLSHAFTLCLCPPCSCSISLLSVTFSLYFSSSDTQTLPIMPSYAYFSLCCPLPLSISHFLFWLVSRFYDQTQPKTTPPTIKMWPCTYKNTSWETECDHVCSFVWEKKILTTFTVLAVKGKGEARGAGALVRAHSVLTCLRTKTPWVTPTLVHICQ